MHRAVGGIAKSPEDDNAGEDVGAAEGARRVARGEQPAAQADRGRETEREQAVLRGGCDRGRGVRSLAPPRLRDLERDAALAAAALAIALVESLQGSFAAIDVSERENWLRQFTPGRMQQQYLAVVSHQPIQLQSQRLLQMLVIRMCMFVIIRLH